MKVLDPGHKYKLLTLDGWHEQELTFVKRHDALKPWRFPGNTESYPGTTLQSVLRALLERVRYLQNQIPCWHNRVIIQMLRLSIWLLEYRAAQRHGRSYWRSLHFAETEPMCPTCGHTDCQHCRCP